jgi:hypothetical protein
MNELNYFTLIVDKQNAIFNRPAFAGDDYIGQVTFHGVKVV